MTALLALRIIYPILVAFAVPLWIRADRRQPTSTLIMAAGPAPFGCSVIEFGFSFVYGDHPYTARLGSLLAVLVLGTATVVVLLADRNHKDPQNEAT